MIRWGHRFIDAGTGVTLDTWFPRTNEQKRRGALAEKLGLIQSDFVEIELGQPDEPANSIEEAYLRLHLLSECVHRPNTLNLDGLFDLLTNVAWTSAGPVLPERVDDLRDAVAGVDQQLTVFSMDKFPRMIDYVVPPGVRIADPDRVRLGAHLVSGTTVMHEGFVNFNAGSIGPAMIEGRVTPGVIVGAGSDVGAGSSIMGTLSGGGKQVNSVGEQSLLGANAGIGISLGDRCVVEAGLYVTAGTKVKTADGQIVKALELSGKSDLLFRRNSQTGGVEAVSSAGVNWGGLNTTLHKQE
ncbi:MAG: tetrahydrodipicolinate succinyltransferase [Pseudomonadales bacterium]|nr:tetrahydrodipicolinate succinyltransferase [Pseudomonadales bacterium]